MVFGNEDIGYKYDLRSLPFREAFMFLKRADLAELPPGWMELEYGVRACIMHYETDKAEKKKFETHERYFDIQYLIEGEEMLGFCMRDHLKISEPYDPERDIVFYEEPACCGNIYLQAGEYAIFAPEDGHKPGCMAKAPSAVKKVVVKVPV